MEADSKEQTTISIVCAIKSVLDKCKTTAVNFAAINCRQIQRKSFRKRSLNIHSCFDNGIQACQVGHTYSKRPKVNTLHDLVVEFTSIAKEGPIYVCCCCEQMWFKKSARNVKTLKEKLSSHHQIYLKDIVNPDNNIHICNTCHKCLQDGRSPTSLSHGLLKLHQIPPQ